MKVHYKPPLCMAVLPLAGSCTPAHLVPVQSQPDPGQKWIMHSKYEPIQIWIVQSQPNHVQRLIVQSQPDPVEIWIVPS